LQTSEQITAFLDSIRDYKLTKVEKLMVVNSVPRSLAALHVLIEEHEDRFSMDEMEALLELVAEAFPPESG
jgi:RNA polymerase Rpb4